MLDLKRLRVLREVAALGSFSAAAESLFVSQSAVSQQVSALEAEVGVPLLVRLRSGPVLTDAGRLLVGHGDAAIARLEQAERELVELSGLARGEIRMVSFPSASATIVTAAASRFSDLHPEIRLSLGEGDPEDSIPALKRGEHDLAVVYDFTLNQFEDDPDLELQPLLTEQMHVALGADHPLAGEEQIELCDLDSDPWLCGNTTTTCREMTVRSCRSANFEPDVAFESNDYGVVKSLVAAGLGVSLLPDLALVQPTPGLVIRPVAHQAPERRVWAATLTAGSRSRATEAMLDVLATVSAEFDRTAAPAAAVAA
ncbi:MAG TPA: LysR family transcriptional regulator [Solirubrobacterales bacterium]|nr:LysR family transcriptional regulator [Solirubrobacterales bacterium]